MRVGELAAFKAVANDGFEGIVEALDLLRFVTCVVQRVDGLGEQFSVHRPAFGRAVGNAIEELLRCCPLEDDADRKIRALKKVLRKREDAISSYNKTWAGYTGLIRVSAPSIKRVMELVWERNTGEDRQQAYEIGYKFRDSTEHLLAQMKDEEKKLWEQVKDLVQRYEDDSSVTKIVEEEKKGR